MKDRTARFYDIVDVRGIAAERGRLLGARLAKSIRSMIDAQYVWYRACLDESPEEVQARALEYLPYIESFSPRAVEEMAGMAVGAGIALAEILIPNCVFELMAARHPLVEQVLTKAQPGPTLCTSFAATHPETRDGHTYLAQNVDGRVIPWEQIYETFDSTIRVHSDTGTTFVSWVHVGSLAMAGMNSHGISLCINNLHTGQDRMGVPYVILLRELLEQRSLQAAISVIDRAHRTGDFNMLLASGTGEIWDVECTATHYDVIHAKGSYAHTNHFTSPFLKSIIAADMGTQPGMSSITRCERVEQLLRQKSGSLDLESMQAICQDHEHRPASICQHQDTGIPTDQQVRTYVSMVMRPSTKEAWFAKGNPCVGKYIRVVLD